MTSPSSENSVRRLAEDRLIKILLETRYDPARCRGTRIEFAYEHLHDELLSLLSEAMEQARTYHCGWCRESDHTYCYRCHCHSRLNQEIKEARSAAFKEAADLCASYSSNDALLHAAFEVIADKLRRKSEGL